MKQEYYFQQMRKEQKVAYRAMYDGFTALSGEFAVPRLSGQELTDIFFRLRLDHPSIFYVCGFSYRFAEQADFVRLIPDYLFEKKKTGAVLLIHAAHIIGGMLCRYFLEFGEVSNTYNFTLPNIAIHMAAISCICLCSYLHIKKKIAENKEE